MRRRTAREETRSDPVLDELLETLAVLDRSVATASGKSIEYVVEERERASMKWRRREAKALAKWRRMTVLEQKAWAEKYLRDARRFNAATKPPKAAELPQLFATLTVANRMLRKREKADAKRRTEKGDSYAGRREAADRDMPAAPARSAAPAPKPAPVVDEPPAAPKARKRRGPAYGPIGQMVDGVFHYYDEEDD